MEIRNEQPSDYREVEELTRQAFWNVSVPGCSEHYLAHILRSHPDFIPELDFILKEDNKIIVNVMFRECEKSCFFWTFIRASRLSKKRIRHSLT